MGTGFAVLGARPTPATPAAMPRRSPRAARRRASTATSLFYVDTLEYLRRGGRMGAAAALVGSALAVKPILRIEDGRVVPYERVRTAGKALSRLEELAVDAAGSAPVDVAVAHLASPGPRRDPGRAPRRAAGRRAGGPAGARGRDRRRPRRARRTWHGRGRGGPPLVLHSCTRTIAFSTARRGRPPSYPDGCLTCRDAQGVGRRGGGGGAPAACAARAGAGPHPPRAPSGTTTRRWWRPSLSTRANRSWCLVRAGTRAAGCRSRQTRRRPTGPTWAAAAWPGCGTDFRQPSRGGSPSAAATSRSWPSSRRSGSRSRPT